MCVGVGITPACAGIRVDTLDLKKEIKDHPRMRGDKIFDNMYFDTYWGSPPHARG